VGGLATCGNDFCVILNSIRGAWDATPLVCGEGVLRAQLLLFSGAVCLLRTDILALLLAAFAHRGAARFARLTARAALRYFGQINIKRLARFLGDRAGGVGSRQRLASAESRHYLPPARARYVG